MIRITLLALLLLLPLLHAHPRDTPSLSCLPDPSLFSTITKDNVAAYLAAFEESGCTPIAILPGIFGSRIMAEIDCETMERESPEVFSTCGWNSCNQESNVLERLLYGLNVPEREYSLWIPQINTPLSPLQLTRNESLCFNYLLAITADPKAPLQERYVSKVKGVSFKMFGQTAETRGKDRCGDSAVRDLFEYFS